MLVYLCLWPLAALITRGDSSIPVSLFIAKLFGDKLIHSFFHSSLNHALGKIQKLNIIPTHHMTSFLPCVFCYW